MKVKDIIVCVLPIDVSEIMIEALHEMGISHDQEKVTVINPKGEGLTELMQVTAYVQNVKQAFNLAMLYSQKRMDCVLQKLKPI